MARRKISTAVQTVLAESFGLGPAAALAAAGLTASVIFFAVFWFFHSAPPRSISITSGPESSVFHANAAKYAAILKRSGVTLRNLPSRGSPENLERLADPSSGVDIGLVQGGVAAGVDVGGLVSLGSVNHQPLLVFYRGARTLGRLAQLEGRRVAVGPEGSGAHALALSLLAANGIKPGAATALEALDPAEAADALLGAKVDAVFLMGDSAPVEIIRRLMHSPSIRLFSFEQADGYLRRFNYLNKMDLPRGAIDLGKDIPAAPVQLVGPSVELVARADLDPTVSDLLLEAAREVHGGPGLFKRAGDFPALQEREFRLSPEAVRFNKSGKSFFYRYLPFRLASFLDRVLVALVPLIIVLIPGLRLIPAAFRWRINLKMYKWYRELLALEQDVIRGLGAADRGELMDRLDRIESAVNKMKVPAPFAGQFYELRGHIAFVRKQLSR